MGKEIERKFLVQGDAWRALAPGVQYRQGYLNSAKERTVRVRTVGERAFLTIKGINTGATRSEYEYPIPPADCNAMLDSLAEKPLIEKTRRKISHRGLIWEVDEFFGENAGLIVAEVELQSEGQAFEKPEWVGSEVTTDPRYFNSNLVRNPYAKWGAARNVATSAAEAAKIVPRAEFRVFGTGIIDIVQGRMWDAGAILQKARHMPPEIYILSRWSGAANVKVRDGLLDIKLKTGVTPEGYEIFQPAGKFRFPVNHADLSAILGHLGADAKPGANTCSYEEFIAIVHGHPHLVPVSVEKMRYGFTVDGVICEYARVWFNGALIETACCESENHAALKKVIEALGIADRPNTGYINAARRIVGIA